MRKFIITTGIILLSVIVLGTILYLNHKKSYTEVVNENWSIELPKPKQELVSFDSGASFQGDGDRYHVFQYGDNAKLMSSLNWTDSRDEVMEAEVTKVIDRLIVSDDQYPDFQNNYRHLKKTHIDGSSMIWLIYFIETQRLYVIEEIF